MICICRIYTICMMICSMCERLTHSAQPMDQRRGNIAAGTRVSVQSPRSVFSSLLCLFLCTKMLNYYASRFPAGVPGTLRAGHLCRRQSKVKITVREKEPCWAGFEWDLGPGAALLQVRWSSNLPFWFYFRCPAVPSVLQQPRNGAFGASFCRNHRTKIEDIFNPF